MRYPVGVFSPADAQQIYDKVIASGGVGSRIDDGLAVDDVIPAVLTSALTAATNPLTGSTAFKFRPIGFTSATSTDMAVSEDIELDGRNRTQAAAEVGTFILVRSVLSEFMLVWADCDATQAVIDALAAISAPA